jgi:hypothetical protein
MDFAILGFEIPLTNIGDMNMFKSKWILVAVLLCVLLPFVANATITRVIGLGGENTNYIVKDPTNSQLWPQLIADWPNLAGAEFYTTTAWDFHKAYLNYGFPNGSVIQLALDNVPGINSSFFGSEAYTYANAVGGAAASIGTTNSSKLSATWGMPLDKMKIGASLNLSEASSKTKDDPPVAKSEQSAMLLGVNLGASFMEDKLDAAVGFETVAFKDISGTTTNSESDGSMAINVSARYWWMYADKMALVPNIRFMNQKDAAKNASGKGSITHTMIKIGAGHNWTPVDNTLAIFEFGINMHNEETKMTPASGSATTVKETYNSLPYWRLGFETKIFGWLNGRLGAQRDWVATTNDDKTTGELATSYSATNLYVGATANWNRLYLDLLVQPSFFQNGPYFVSGAGNSMFSRVSLKYDFNK